MILFEKKSDISEQDATKLVTETQFVKRED